MPDHLHQAAHTLLPAWAECCHDAVIANACTESFIRDLQLAGIDAEAGERATGTQRAQGILERTLCTERLYAHVRAAASQLLDLRDDIHLAVIECHVRAHRPRHR